MPKNLTSLEMIEVLQIIGGLAWQDKHRDLAGFDGADMIADVPNEAAGRLSELTGVDEAHGLLAVIGGDDADSRQLEIHGCAADGEPQSWAILLQPWSN